MYKNTLKYNSKTYGVLTDDPVDAHGEKKQSEWLPLPDGCHIAPDS